MKLSTLSKRLFDADLAACLRLEAERKEQVRKLRDDAVANRELERVLVEDARCRGRVFSWHDYFLQMGWY